jgi:NTE family protein
MPSRRTKAKGHTLPPAVDLALQGGGSHGAFTWGVLDRLLEPDGLEFGAACGTSAGALNAAVLATGLAHGGREGARAALRSFWLDVSGQRECFGGERPAWLAPWGANPFAPNPFAALPGFNLDANPFYAAFSALWRGLSPYQFNPLNLNPLRTIARRHVDEDALRHGPLQVFVVATAVASGQAEVFRGQRLSIDALMASACLPQMFQAVTIDGVDYWDGGYSGNPALWPLIYDTPPLDVVLVKINPLVRTQRPDTALEIADRVNEITFNASLAGEMRAIHFVKRLLAERRLEPARYKDLRLHMIADDDGLAPLNPSSKLNTDLRFLEQLHALGRAAAGRWLAAHRRDVGVRSTLDIEATFLRRR